MPGACPLLGIQFAITFQPPQDALNLAPIGVKAGAPRQGLDARPGHPAMLIIGVIGQGQQDNQGAAFLL
jgi:hypothetical protein